VTDRTDRRRTTLEELRFVTAHARVVFRVVGNIGERVLLGPYRFPV
jgi:hypothetical protein